MILSMFVVLPVCMYVASIEILERQKYIFLIFNYIFVIYILIKIFVQVSYSVSYLLETNIELECSKITLHWFCLKLWIFVHLWNIERYKRAKIECMLCTKIYKINNIE